MFDNYTIVLVAKVLDCSSDVNELEFQVLFTLNIYLRKTELSKMELFLNAKLICLKWNSFDIETVLMLNEMFELELFD